MMQGSRGGQHRFRGWQEGSHGWMAVAGLILLGAWPGLSRGQVLPPASDPGAIQRRSIELEQRLREEREPAPGVQQPLKKGEPVGKSAPPPASAVRFSLRRIEFSSSAILPPEQLAAIARDYEGREVSLAELQAVLERINRLYEERGIVTARAILPPQDIVGGVVRIRLIEGRVGAIAIAGNDTTRGDYVGGWIKQQPGALADMTALERDLIRFNRSNDAQLAAELKPGKQFGESDIQIQVSEPPRRYLRLFADNGGSHATGELRSGFLYQDRSVLGLRDALGLSYTHADGHDGQGLTYSLPINTWGTRVVGAYNFDKTHVRHGPFRPLNITGEAQSYGLDMKHPLFFDSSRALEGMIGFRNRRVSSWIGPLFLQRTDTKDGHAALEWQSVDPRGIWSASINHLVGEAEFVGARGKGYGISRGFLRRSQDLGNGWTFLGTGTFQATPNRQIPSSEQFLIGGDGSVRGYETGLFSGDRGYGANLELHHPLPLGTGTTKLSAFLFIDHGVAYPFRPVGSQRGREELSGAGWGFDVGFADQVTAKVTFGFALRDRQEEKSGFYVNAQVVALVF